ncbi:MAG: PAS domain S-box protein [Candidatus Eisenbacteria bacterium]|nr:PAS domain S-box protein [Candidatus Eisenbacteria bacterium]
MNERENHRGEHPERTEGYESVEPGGAVEALLDGVAVVDGKGRFLRANGRFCAIVGYEERELLERSVFDLMEQSTASEARAEGDRLRQGEAISGKTVFLRKTGGTVPVAFSILPLVDPTGDLLGVVVTISDQARYTRLEREKLEKEARFRTLADHANDGIIISLKGGKHVYANPRMEQISGYSIEELLRLNLFDLAHPDERDRLRANNERRLSGESVETGYETAIRHKSGRKIVVEITPSRTEWGGHPANLVIVRDVSVRIRTEKVLREERDRAQRYLDAAEVILVALDRSAGIRLINRKGCSVLGWGESDLLGRNWIDTCVPERRRPSLWEFFHKILKQEDILEGAYENEVLTRSGEERLVSWTNTILTDEKGKPTGVLSCGEDVTERRQAERALRESEERYRLLVDNSPVPILIHCEEKVVFLNRAAAEMLAVSGKELVGTNILNIVSPAYHEIARKRMRWVYGRESKAPKIALRFIRKGGEEIDVETEATSVVFQGRPAAQVVFWDVTERVRAEEVRREEVRRTDILGRITTIGNRAENVDSLLREVLAATAGLLGFDAGGIYLVDAAERKAFLEIEHGLPEEFPDRLRGLPIETEPFRRIFIDGEPIIDTDLLEDGRERIGAYGFGAGASLPLWMNGRVVGSLNLACRGERRIIPRDREILRAISRELSAAYTRLRAQEALRESEIRFRTIFDKAPVAIYLENMNGDILDANAEAEKLTGFRREELIGMNARDLVPPDLAGHIPEIIRQTVEQNGYSAEVTNLNREGKSIPCRVESTVIRLGGRTYFFVITQDITKEVEARAILEESERRFRTLYENAPLAYQSIDPAGCLIGVNDAWLDLLGYEREEVIGRPFRNLVAPEARENYDEWFRVLFSTGAIDAEFPIVRVTGEPLVVSFNGRTGVDSLGRIDRAHCILADVTERKRRQNELEDLVEERTLRIRELERRQRAVDRLAATARLAAGIAHEINNPLAAIKNSISLIRDAVPPDHPNLEFVEIVQNEIERLAEIVRLMYTIYKPSESTIRTFRIASLLDDVVKLIAQGEKGRGGEVETAIDPPNLTVRLGEGALRTAIFNVIRNALEASPDRSTVSVRVKKSGRDRFVIEVEDRGEGIAEEIADKVFEPFFTTKTSGPTSGMGLGLSLTRTLVESIGGTIDFTGGAGGGTVFRIRLPIEDQGRN